MNYDHESAAQKKEEIIRNAEDAIKDYLLSIGEEKNVSSTLRIATEMTKNFTQIIPPEMPRMEMITMRYGGYGGGSSTKPGNVLFNFSSLFDWVSRGVILAFGTIGPPWVMVLAGLVSLNKLRSSLRVTISEREAVVLWAMWEHRDHNRQIDEDSLLDLVNSELASKGRPKISQHEVEVSLESPVAWDVLNATPPSQAIGSSANRYGFLTAS
jgi:hypothetical protein